METQSQQPAEEPEDEVVLPVEGEDDDADGLRPINPVGDVKELAGDAWDRLTTIGYAPVRRMWSDYIEGARVASDALFNGIRGKKKKRD